MRQIRNAVKRVVPILLAAILILAVQLTAEVYTQGSRWTSSSYNTRLTAARSTTGMGNITDRNDVLLAYTDANGRRVYSSDKTTRRALSQTVGDQLSMSGTGVETFHAGTLLGTSASLISRTWQYLSGEGYTGDNIRLTVDSELCAYASEIFPDKYKGAVAVINYKTGEILCLVSKPDYDPQSLSDGTDDDSDAVDSVYLNRCLQGQYAPGSVFKIVTLAAVLENIPDAINRTYTCNAERAFGNGKVTCFGGTAHGEMSLLQAFGKSCNVTFASLAYELGDKALVETAEKLGFNDDFSFRDIVLYTSSIPETISDISELAWTGVGQGKLLVTPLHMAMIAGAVANDGVMQEPQLISQITGSEGIARLRTPNGEYGAVMEATTASVVKEYMRRCVAQGTGKKAALSDYTVCGKTGTAEVSNDSSAATNAWFVGFVDSEEYPYAIAVVVEEGGNGGSTAAPLAAKVLQKAIDRT